MDFSTVENRINYVFKDKNLLKLALTLSSASEENNERLEFFGDAILQMIVSERLYNEGGDEGFMTARRQNIVSADALEAVSEKLELDKYLIRGKGDTRNLKAVSSVYEAVTAAIYLDGGMDAAKKFVLNSADFSKKKAAKNYKGELQELLQGRGKGLPVYVNSNIGTPQNPRFRVEVSFLNKTVRAEGANVKEAEQLAAKKAITFIKR